MTDAETLTKAIEKAIENGWKPELDMGTIDDQKRYILKLSKPFHIRGIIMSHDFARALWGLDRLLCDLCDVDIEQNDKECWNCNSETFVYGAYQNTKDNLPNWQYHLQQMVIAENPIKYLRENI